MQIIENHRGLQNKTIIKVLNKKIDEWIASIQDIDVQTLAKKNTIITGGSIASMCMGDKVNDFDVYFRNKETAVAVAEYYASIFDMDINVRTEERKNILGDTEERVFCYIESSGVSGSSASHEEHENDSNKQLLENIGVEVEDQEDQDKPPYTPVFVSENAITLNNKFQIIIRFYGEPKEIHRNYDFVHAMCYYDYAKKELDLPSEALRSMQSKTLYYRGSLYPICSLFRIRKFMKRGWNISAGEILKISLQISNICLTDVDTLRDQLTGVDALYFSFLINALEKVKDKYPNGIPNCYVIEVIDRVFGESI